MVDGFGCDVCHREASHYWRFPSGEVVCPGCTPEIQRKKEEVRRASLALAAQPLRFHRLNFRVLDRAVACALCGRRTHAITKHHLIPRSVGTDGKTARLCVPCHRGLHAALTNEELAALARKGGLDALRADPRVRALVAGNGGPRTEMETMSTSGKG